MFGFGKKADVRTVSPDEAHALSNKGEVLLVDVREQGEWAQGHIPGAKLLPMSRFAAEAGNLPTDKPVVFYCLSGARSANAVSLSKQIGLPHDTHMAGGISAWRAHRLPVSTD